MNDCKPICKFGESCYRLQTDHFVIYSHPHLNTLLKENIDREICIPSSYSPKISENCLISQLKIVKSLVNSPRMNNMSNEETSSGRQHSEFKSDPSSLKRELTSYMEQIRKRSKIDVLTKLEHAEPYRFFLSSIAAENKTHNEMLTLSFFELLSEKLGILESSLQLNFMVQISWLLAQYAVNNDKSTPITLIYGNEDPELNELLSKNLLPNLCAKYVKPSAFGSHHTKMMILSYEDKSIRVIVTTGNLIEFDWENTVQGIWVSPRLPVIDLKNDNHSQYDSPTNFKRDLLQYLEQYNLSILQSWIDKVKNADFRSVKVFFVASVPGSHAKSTTVKWGLHKIDQLLSNHAFIPNENATNWPLYYQCSSIGSLGKDPYAWFLGEVTRCMSSNCQCSSFQPPVKLIYPSFNDVASSHDGLLAGGCLPYSETVHNKQTWLTEYLCKWRSDNRFRTRAVPHIKTYCRISPCKKLLSWFLLTSANLSKAAWGMETKAKKDLRILSYEVGVLFMPSVLIEKNMLPLTDDNATDGPQFPLPYDCPLISYNKDDKPWFIDLLQNV